MFELNSYTAIYGDVILQNKDRWEYPYAVWGYCFVNNGNEFSYEVLADQGEEKDKDHYSGIFRMKAQEIETHKLGELLGKMYRDFYIFCMEEDGSKLCISYSSDERELDSWDLLRELGAVPEIGCVFVQRGKTLGEYPGGGSFNVFIEGWTTVDLTKVHA